MKLLASEAMGIVRRTFPRPLKVSLVPTRDLVLGAFPLFS